MVLDMNIKLEGIDEEFLEELEELIDDTRVEYFIINPKDKDELINTQKICSDCERFKYTLPVEFKDMQDENCVALKISKIEDLESITKIPLVVDSKDINDELIEKLNSTDMKGVVLNSKESDKRLENFACGISQDTLKDWSKEGITDIDVNRISLQSDYPKYTYDDLFDVLLKDISDLNFRPEQTIAAGGTRSTLKMFGLL